jgi:hypothetical protein
MWARIAGTFFDYADLRGANFRGATFDHASFRWADLRGADLSSTGMLTGVDFRGANVHGAKFGARRPPDLMYAVRIADDSAWAEYLRTEAMGIERPGRFRTIPRLHDGSPQHCLTGLMDPPLPEAEDL